MLLRKTEYYTNTGRKLLALLFYARLMKFQNISKNKDMFDLIDISEVDGCFYGLFLDHSKPTQDSNNARQSYTVFKVTT